MISSERRYLLYALIIKVTCNIDHEKKKKMQSSQLLGRHIVHTGISTDEIALRKTKLRKRKEGSGAGKEDPLICRTVKF